MDIIFADERQGGPSAQWIEAFSHTVAGILPPDGRGEPADRRAWLLETSTFKRLEILVG